MHKPNKFDRLFFFYLISIEFLQKEYMYMNEKVRLR